MRVLELMLCFVLVAVAACGDDGGTTDGGADTSTADTGGGGDTGTADTGSGGDTGTADTGAGDAGGGGDAGDASTADAASCMGAHPIVGPPRTCESGFCFCSGDNPDGGMMLDVCYPMAQAEACCPIALMECVE